MHCLDHAHSEYVLYVELDCKRAVFTGYKHTYSHTDTQLYTCTIVQMYK